MERCPVETVIQVFLRKYILYTIQFTFLLGNIAVRLFLNFDLF